MSIQLKKIIKLSKLNYDQIHAIKLIYHSDYSPNKERRIYKDIGKLPKEELKIISELLTKIDYDLGYLNTCFKNCPYLDNNSCNVFNHQNISQVNGGGYSYRCHACINLIGIEEFRSIIKIIN